MDLILTPPLFIPTPSLFIPKDEKELMQLAHEDPRFIIESAFQVVNKDKQAVPFIFKTLQNEFYENRTTRDDILKAGQLGFSTMILAIFTVKFLLVPNAWCVCISHQEEATQRLFERVTYFLENLPDWLKPFYVPGKTAEGDIVNKAMNSKFYIGTAGARAFGRGDTIHYAHLSEVSRWRGSGEVATGIIRAVPLNDPNTWIVKETTANGVGNYHHTEWKRERDEKSDFRPHFVPFYKQEEYRMIGVLKDKTEEEDRYQRRFPLMTDEVLLWRRKMINTLSSENGRTPEDMFKQEFPADETEAFLFSGNPIFPVEQLQEYLADAVPPVLIGNLQGVSPYESFDANTKGYFKIWDPPEISSQYIAFADVGQFSDYCVCTIVNKKTWKMVAKFRAVIRAVQFGDELNVIGHYYNKMLIAVEVNNMGQSTVDRLVTLSYPSLYKRKRKDQKTKRYVDEIGWNTNRATKPLMIGHMQELIRTEAIDLPDEEILIEMQTFVKHQDGSMAASEGNNDDQVISVCGVYYVLKENPFIEKSNKVSAATVNKAQKYKEMRSSKGIKRWRQ